MKINSDRLLREFRHRTKKNIANIPYIEYIELMEWKIIFDPDFRIWFYQQEQGFQDETFVVLERKIDDKIYKPI